VLTVSDRPGAPATGRKAEELPKEINVDDYTRYISMLLAGLSIQAANGSTEAELKRASQMALRYLGY
jgi:hypothetical protein